MCLQINIKKTAELKKLLAGKKYISVYKYCDISRRGNGIILSTIFYHRWQVGENVSSRIAEIGGGDEEKAANFTSTEKGINEVNHGFHVYLNRDGYGCSEYIRLIAKAKNFVAAGCDNDAVFTKLTLPQSEYNKIFGKKKSKKAS